MRTCSFITTRVWLAILCAGASLGAQSTPVPAPPSTVSAAHEPLSFFEGLWTVEEVPAARELRERCEWMEGGRRHMICRSRSRSAAGDWREGLSMFSYRDADSSYVYYGLRPGGGTQQLVGKLTIGAKTWEFAGEEGTGASRVRTRVRINRLPAGRFRFIEQTATTDAPFTTADTIHYRPARPGTGAP